MHLGDIIEGNKRIPLINERLLEPVLIIGKHYSLPLLHKLLLDDIYAGKGATYFGDASELLPLIPAKRVKDTILFQLDYEHPRSFNPLSKVKDEERSEIAEYIVDSFSAAYPSNIPTALLDNNLLAASLAMLETGGTLYAARHLFTSEKYRKKVIGQIKDPDLKNFWQLFHDLDGRDQHQQASSVLNRLLPLTTDPWYRNIIGQTNSFKLRETDILIVDLPKGRKATLLAALIMARLTGPVYITNPLIFVGRGNPVIACRYLDELPEKIRTELIATATLLSFRLGVKDAKLLQPEFNIPNQDFSLTDLQPGDAYVRLNSTHRVRIPESDYTEQRCERKIRNRSRSEYSVHRRHIEKKIADFITNL